MAIAGDAEAATLLATLGARRSRRSTPIRRCIKKYPFYHRPLLKSIETAKPRPKAVKYGDVTLAIQDAAYGALQGQTAA